MPVVSSPTRRPSALPARLPSIEREPIKVAELPVKAWTSKPVAMFDWNRGRDYYIPWQFEGNGAPRPIDTYPDITEGPRFENRFLSVGRDVNRAISLAHERAGGGTDGLINDAAAQLVLRDPRDGVLYLANANGPMWSDESGPMELDLPSFEVDRVKALTKDLVAVVGRRSAVRFDKA